MNLLHCLLSVSFGLGLISLATSPNPVNLTNLNLTKPFIRVNGTGLNQNTNNQSTTEEITEYDILKYAYEGCGIIKKCMSTLSNKHLNEKCIAGKSCSMIVAMGKGLGETPTNDEVVIELFANAHGWAGIGISRDDDRMGDDYVIECVKEGHTIKIYNSWNIHQVGHKKNNTNRRLVNQSVTDNVRPIRLVIKDYRLYCKFYVKKEFKKTDPYGKVHEFDLTKSYHYIFAFSNAVPSYGPKGNIGNHLVHGSSSEPGRDKIIASKRYSPLPFQARFFRLHGSCMVFGWLFFLSISIFFARYLRGTFPLKRFCKLQIWHFFHILTAVLAFIFIMGSFILSYFAKVGWINLYNSGYHFWSGYTSVGLLLFELILGIFTKVRTIGEKKAVLNLVHSIVGHCTYVFAMITMLMSNKVAYGFLSCGFSTYIYAWLGIYAVTHLVMTYHKCWVQFLMGKGYLHEEGAVTNRNTLSVQVAVPLVSQSILRNKDKDDESLDGSNRSSVSTISTILSEENTAFIHRGSRKTLGLISLVNRPGQFAVEAPGMFVRVWALATFFIITAVYTYWINRKLMSYIKHCYNFLQLVHWDDKHLN